MLLLAFSTAALILPMGGVDSMSVKNENAGVIVAMKVAGFDAILLGHDHSLMVQESCRN